MAVTREERMWEAMLNDAPEKIPTAVTRKEKMLKKIAKQACENDTFCGGGNGGNSGGGLPVGGEPYKQLVTDADGKTVWEDKLAYEQVEKTLRPHSELENISFSGTEYELFSVFDTLDAHKEYQVELDSETYTVTCVEDGDPGYGSGSIGDKNLIDYPFYIFIHGGYGDCTIAVSTAGEHTLSVYRVQTKTSICTIDPKFLPTPAVFTYKWAEDGEGEGTYICSKTHEQCVSDFKNGVFNALLIDDPKTQGMNLSAVGAHYHEREDVLMYGFMCPLNNRPFVLEFLSDGTFSFYDPVEP